MNFVRFDDIIYKIKVPHSENPLSIHNHIGVDRFAKPKLA